MVRDGYFYGFGLIAAAILIAWLTSPAWAIIPLLLAAFFLWFFRDPERAIPQDPGAVVSPADGKVTDVSAITLGNQQCQRVSIFLSVFDVHVNRSPIAGVIRDIRHQSGKFLDARSKDCAELNEQNIVTVEGDATRVVFRQIAGLIARRIVFNRKPGDHVAAGERVGLIKFGSRVDLLLGPEWEIVVHPGQHVAGGSSVIARRRAAGA